MITIILVFKGEKKNLKHFAEFGVKYASSIELVDYDFMTVKYECETDDWKQAIRDSLDSVDAIQMENLDVEFRSAISN